MVKKSLIAGITAMILSLCCGMCFAANDNQKSVNLGNEITKSMDKAGQSMQNVTDNVFSGNVINNAKNGVTNMTNGITNGMNNMDNNMRNDEINNRADNRMVNDTRTDVGNYNTTRTAAETTAMGVGTMSTTTWMWIILAVSAIIIIAAVWYYATQNNE